MPYTARARRTVTGSSLTLGGLLKHLALVEDEYLTRRLLGQPMPAPWDAVDWDAEPDWEWRTAGTDRPETLYGLWRDAVARSREHVAKAVADGGAGYRAAYVSRTGESPSLRRLLVDMIEEYGRHTGHADLLREVVDGRVGEDPLAGFQF
ncbi:DUF664 domain-containing protein [Streptomyces sp. NPDC047028]|uniref:mycothiol transferase n=1 Tax=Streptomyces sp. NPDC047028 TaxID=3155793 RepID=UPI0033F19BD2